MDGIVPDCRVPGKKCLIPQLEENGLRIKGLFELITRLKGVVDAGAILNIAGADLDDLALLAVYVETMKKARE